uniref:Uncharacterized protein n=1 Tax=Oryza glumipatula TaxID=40148 RepID=A0A0D9YDB9_9ORYZ
MTLCLRAPHAAMTPPSSHPRAVPRSALLASSRRRRTPPRPAPPAPGGSPFRRSPRQRRVVPLSAGALPGITRPPPSSLLPVAVHTTAACPRRRRGGSPFRRSPAWVYPTAPRTRCGTRHSGLRLSSPDDILIPFTCLSNPCEGQRLQLHRLQAIDCGRYNGGDKERFAVISSLLSFAQVATYVLPTIGSSKGIVRRINTQTFLGFTISLLQPTALPALPTTTPTRATAEASHRAEEASQVWNYEERMTICRTKACVEEKGKLAKFVGRGELEGNGGSLQVEESWSGMASASEANGLCCHSRLTLEVLFFFLSYR